MSFAGRMLNEGRGILRDPGKILKTAANPGAAITGAGLNASGFKGIDGYGDELGLGRYEATPYNVNQDRFLKNDAMDGVQKSFAEQLAASQGRMAPTMDPTQQAQFRGSQMALAQQLAEQAEGKGPSLAANQLQQSTDRGIAQAMAMANSQPGMSAGARGRMASNQAAQIQGQAGMNAANARIMEQNAARQSLAGVLAQGRGQDIGMASQNLGAAMQQQGMNDAQGRFFNQGLFQGAQQQGQNAMDLERLIAQQMLGTHQINAGGYASQQQAKGNMIGNVAGGATAWATQPGA